MPTGLAIATPARARRDLRAQSLRRIAELRRSAAMDIGTIGPCARRDLRSAM